MDRWLRRLRGALGMGVAWAFAWFGAGLVLLMIVGPDAADVPFPLGFGLLGFFAGVIFSGVVSLVGGRRDFDQLSIPRFSAWGAVGGLLFSVVFVLAVAVFGNDRLELMVLGPVFGLAGAASAAGALALARRAGEPAALDAGADTPEIGRSIQRTRPPGGGAPSRPPR